jgi:hypothetical protein
MRENWADVALVSVGCESDIRPSPEATGAGCSTPQIGLVDATAPPGLCDEASDIWRILDLTGSAVCLICRSSFVTRLRLIRHLSDPRPPRDRCRNSILASAIPALPLEEVERLDALDKLARQEARKQGHTVPIAVGTSRTCAGKAIGYVKA